jgi:hypothetical protein
MSPNQSNIPSATDTTITDAIAAATPVTVQDAPVDTQANAEAQEFKRLEQVTNARKAEALRNFASAMLKRMRRHNTPFDGKKKATKRAKAKSSRKANKKRKLYLRYGKQ